MSFMIGTAAAWSARRWSALARSVSARVGVGELSAFGLSAWTLRKTASTVDAYQRAGPDAEQLQRRAEQELAAAEHHEAQARQIDPDTDQLAHNLHSTRGGGLLTRAGVEDCKLHEARHTAITEVVRDTGNLKLAQMLAGHASIQTTADIYAHLDVADLADALQIVAERRAERRQTDAK